ncbi:MAG: GTP-binding protein [Promethearchaeota archaeon]|nr:MAG: GTP-binding protein [Candidatus Lokiarchaeota archaeon]
MAKKLDPIQIKLVILGDGAVGKTSLASHYLKKEIPKRYIPTIGSIILKKDYKLNNKQQIKVNIWDIGGQRSFNPLNPSFYTNVDAAYLVFDLTKPKDSISVIKNVYLENLDKYAKDCQTIVVGNKLDLISDKEDLKKINKLLSENVPIFISSAKTGENVNETFEILIHTFLKNWEAKHGNEDYIGTAEYFLKSINKKEDELNAILVNLEDVSKIKVKASKIKEKAQSSKAEKKSTLPKTDTSKKMQESMMDKYLSISEEKVKLDAIKSDIITEFERNLNEIEKLVSELKKTSIESLIESIEKTKIEIELIKKDFMASIDSFFKIEDKNKN